MGISVSTYYHKKKKMSEEDKELLKMIEEICQKLPMCGYQKMTKILKRERIVNHKRVYRLMRQNGLLCPKRASKPTYTTNTLHKLKRYPNLLKEAKITGHGQAIVGDVTAYDMHGSNGFLATLKDVCSRKVVGFAVSKRNNTALVKSALENAKQTLGDLSGCIHHTDSDVRYCSYEYTKLLKSYGMKISMCLGNVYENAQAESWNATVKREEIRVNDYESIEDSARGIYSYIKIYNEYRPHSSIGDMTPVEFENLYR